MKNDKEFEDAEHELAAKVRITLKDRYGTVPAVASEIDRIILADARRHFEEQRPATQRPARRRRISTWQWTAIASSVITACVMILALWPPPPNPENRVAAGSEARSPNEDLSSDVDLNGRVDILDAFTMARQMRDGRGRVHDFNHDGRIDQFDIDLVAREAVKL